MRIVTFVSSSDSSGGALGRLTNILVFDGPAVWVNTTEST